MERTRLSLSIYSEKRLKVERTFWNWKLLYLMNGDSFCPPFCFILSHNIIAVLERDDDDDVNDDDEKSIDRSIVSRLEKTYTV